MPFEFQVSDEFKNVLNSHQGAIQEARLLEKFMGGLNLPEGTSGTATLVKMKGGQNGPVKDNETGQMISGSHFIEFKSLVNSPEQYKGEIASRRFNLNQTENSSIAQRWGRAYDYMEDMGLPRNIRETGDIQQMVAWFNQQERSFDYEVEGYDFNGKRSKNFEARGVAGGGGMPQPTQTMQQSMQQPLVAPGMQPQQPLGTQPQQPTTSAFQVGQRVYANGNPSVVQRIEGNLATVRLEANGQEMPVAINMLRAI